MLMLSLYDVIIYLHVCILNLLLWNGRGSPQRQHDDWIPLVSVPGLCVVFSFCFLCVLLPVVRGWFWTAVLVPIPDWWTTTLTAYANRQMFCLPSGLAYSSAPIAFEGASTKAWRDSQSAAALCRKQHATGLSCSLLSDRLSSLWYIDANLWCLCPRQPWLCKLSFGRTEPCLVYIWGVLFL